MSHLNSGELRRMLDEPEAFDDESRRHVRECATCGDASNRIRDDAAFAARHLGTAAPALQPRRRPRIPVAAAGIAAAAAIVIALFATPLGSYAQAFLTIFEPHQVVAVAVDPGAFANRQDVLPDLNQIGTARELAHPVRRDVASLNAARPYVPFRVLEPSVWAPQLPHTASFRVMTAATESFTFSSLKARSYALRNAGARIAVPPAMDGATIDATIGPMVVAFFGSDPDNRDRRARRDMQPFVTVVQSVAPRVSATRVTFDELKAYVASLPGVTPNMAAEIEALSEGALPIPFRPDRQHAQNVIVQGVRGLAIGDNTGLGAGVVWEKNGVLYGVAGTLSESDVLAFANGLR